MSRAAACRRMTTAFIVVGSAGTLGCRDTASSSPSAISAPGSPTATDLVFSVEPTDGLPGITLNPDVRVTVLDARRRTVTAYTGAVTVSLADNLEQATLRGGTTVAASAGVATFSGLQIDKAASGLVLIATARDISAVARSTPFKIDAAPLDVTLNGRIAFLGNTGGPTHIYVASANGTGVTRLTQEPALYGRPAWSPDATKITAAAEGLGVFIMNADGSGVTKVANEGSDPAWSPDGSRIRFKKGLLQVPPTNLEIDEVTVDGSVTTRLGSGVYGGHLAWSPDGKDVAFDLTTDVGGGDYFTQVYLNSADGTRLRRLTSPSLRPDGNAEGGAAWSPDGKRIAFWSYGYGLATIASDGSGSPSAIVNDGSVWFGANATWSPDGKWLAFVRGSPGTIWVVYAGGGTPRRVMEGWYPAWSPK